MHDIIREKRAAERALEQISQSEDHRRKRVDEAADKQLDIIRDKERAVREERYQVERKLEEDREQIRQQAKEAREVEWPAIEKHKRVIKLLEILREQRKPAYTVTKSTQYWAEKLPEPIKMGNLYEDDTAIVDAWIAPSRKPVNKFQLVIVGNSIFNYRYSDDKLVDYPQSYGLDIREEDANIRVLVKEAPTIEALKSYFEKNKAKLGALWKQEAHEATVQEYRWVRANCMTEEWEIELLLSRKHYYEHNYSGGTSTPEYAEIMRELKHRGVRL